ncbi:MAG: AzlC family ABC transporter permease [Saccharofermentanales bacterium]|jgi:4-azaleucine resistance transporter AzlC
MSRKDWFAGFKKIVYVMLSYIPLGLACGIALDKAGFSPFSVMIMSLLVFAGAGQFMIAQLVSVGSSPISIIVTIFFVNSRHLLMSSGLAQYLKGKSIGFYLLFAQTIVDETFGTNITQFTTNPEWTPSKALTTNILAHVSWIISSLCGALIGQNVNIPLTVVNYVLVAMFIAMLVEQILSKIHLIAAIAAGILSIILKLLLRNNISLVIAAVIASTIGFIISGKTQIKLNSVKGETLRGETLRGETVRGETVRGETLRGEAVRGKTVRGEHDN